MTAFNTDPGHHAMTLKSQASVKKTNADLIYLAIPTPEAHPKGGTVSINQPIQRPVQCMHDHDVQDTDDSYPESSSLPPETP